MTSGLGEDRRRAVKYLLLFSAETCLSLLGSSQLGSMSPNERRPSAPQATTPTAQPSGPLPAIAADSAAPLRVKVAYLGMPIILTPTDDEVLEMPASSALKDMASKMEVLLDGLQGEDGVMLREGDEVDFMFPVGGG